jgi:hypothetical protein
VARYGVLHDRARLAHRGEGTSSERVSRDTPWAFDGAAHAAEGAVLCVPTDCRGRYVMLPAARELFVAECVRQLPRVHGGDDPEGLDGAASVAEGAALQQCVFEGSSLRELLRLVCRGRECHPEQPDPGARTRQCVRARGDDSVRWQALRDAPGTRTPRFRPLQQRGARHRPDASQAHGTHLVKARAPFPATHWAA